MTDKAPSPLDLSAESRSALWWKHSNSLKLLYDWLSVKSLKQRRISACEWLTCLFDQADDGKPLYQGMALGVHDENTGKDKLCLSQVSVGISHSKHRCTSDALRARNLEIDMAGHISQIKQMPGRDSPQSVLAVADDTGQISVLDMSGLINGKQSISRLHSMRCRQPSRVVCLDWNKARAGLLISAGGDGLMSLWSIDQEKRSGGAVPVRCFRGTLNTVVRDLCWSCEDENLFVSSGADRKLSVWDLRSDDERGPVASSSDVHHGDVTSVHFSPYSEHMLLSGSRDQTIKLHSLRNLSRPLHSFEGHHSEVLNALWSPDNEALFLSASSDGHAFIWDICRIGDYQTMEDAEDGPPEMLFVHGSHSDAIADIKWNPAVAGVVGSVTGSGEMHVWKMSDLLLDDSV